MAQEKEPSCDKSMTQIFYRCPHKRDDGRRCNVKETNFNLLLNHFYKYHVRERLLTKARPNFAMHCFREKCTETFLNHYKLVEHMQCHHGENIYFTEYIKNIFEEENKNLEFEVRELSEAVKDLKNQCYDDDSDENINFIFNISIHIFEAENMDLGLDIRELSEEVKELKDQVKNLKADKNMLQRSKNIEEEKARMRLESVRGKNGTKEAEQEGEKNVKQVIYHCPHERDDGCRCNVKETDLNLLLNHLYKFHSMERLLTKASPKFHMHCFRENCTDIFLNHYELVKHMQCHNNDSAENIFFTEYIKQHFEQENEDLNLEVRELKGQLQESLKRERAQMDLLTSWGVSRKNEKSSWQKGDDGEKKIYQLLQARFPNSIIERTSGGHKGNIVITLPVTGLMIMIEVKNLKSGLRVPPEQVNRFHQDLATNEDFAGGLLVSLNGPVSDQESFKPFIPSACNKPAMFVNNLITEDNVIAEDPGLVLKVCLLNFQHVLQIYSEKEKCSHLEILKTTHDTLIEQTLEIKQNVQKVSKNVRRLEKIFSSAKNLLWNSTCDGKGEGVIPEEIDKDANNSMYT